MCLCEGCWQRLDSVGAGISDGCEPPNVGAGNKCCCSAKLANALSQQTISPAIWIKKK